MSLYRYSVTRCGAHAMRVAGQDSTPDPLEVASDARMAELAAATIAASWFIARRRAEHQPAAAADLRERAPEASRRIA